MHSNKHPHHSGKIIDYDHKSVYRDLGSYFRACQP